MGKIAISIPDQILEAVEKARLSSGESRSQFFRRAVEGHLDRQKERAAVERYVAGYRKNPETEEDIQMAESVLGRVLAENPWEDAPEP